MKSILRISALLGVAFSLVTMAQGEMGQARTGVATPAVTPTRPAVTPSKPAPIVKQPANTGAKSRPDDCRDGARGHFRGYYPYGFVGYGYYGGVNYVGDLESNADYVSEDVSRTASGPSTFFAKGRDWGQDLRRDVVSWAQFVQYMKTEIVNAVPWMQDEFRRGFVEAYGTNGEAAFEKAATATRGESRVVTPKVITMPEAEKKNGSE